jgi:hypothetical protein
VLYRVKLYLSGGLTPMPLDCYLGSFYTSAETVHFNESSYKMKHRKRIFIEDRAQIKRQICSNVLDAYKSLPKQRDTAVKIFSRLRDEYEFTDGESSVRGHVHQIKELLELDKTGRLYSTRF